MSSLAMLISCRMTHTQCQTTSDSLTLSKIYTPDTAAEDLRRMRLYEEREREFLEFVSETTPTEEAANDFDVDDRPLSGLHCLLALTEILDRAAHLRLTNFDLEQRIDMLQQLKQIAEVC